MTTGPTGRGSVEAHGNQWAGTGLVNAKRRSGRWGRTHRDDGEHHLGDVERVAPVVVGDVAVVLLDAEQPTAQHVLLDVEPFDQVQVHEHAQARLLHEMKQN